MENFDLIVNRALDDGRYVVTNNGAEIKIGTTLKHVALTRYQGRNVFPNESMETLSAVHMTLETADIFRKPVELVARGWSAAVAFGGVGGEFLAKALCDKDERDQIHLTG